MTRAEQRGTRTGPAGIRGRVRALLVLLLVAMPGLAPSSWAKEGPGDSRKVTKLVKKGHALLERQDIEGALEAFERAKELSDGSSYHALMGLARTHLEVLNFKNVGELAESAIELGVTGRELSEACLLAGMSYYESSLLLAAGLEAPPAAEDRHPAAEGFFRRAIEAAPDASSEPRYYLARVLADQGKYEPAKQLLREYLATEPKGELAAPARAQLSWMQRPADEPEITSAVWTEAGDTLPQEAPDMIAPVAIYSPQPQYTLAARLARVQGLATVQGIVDKYGRVVVTRLLSGIRPDLDQVALYVFRKWTFEPARLEDGRPVAVYYTLVINFQLQ